jgi:hypothetical protein
MSERYGAAFSSFTSQFGVIIKDVHANLAKSTNVNEVKSEAKMN